MKITIPKYYYWLVEQELTNSNPDRLKIDRINAFIKQLTKRNVLTQTQWHPIATKGKGDAYENGLGETVFKVVDGWITNFFPSKMYKKYLTFLENIGCIEINHKYSINNNVSKMARLKPLSKKDKFNDEFLEMIEVSAHKKYYDFVKQEAEVDKNDKDVMAVYNLLTSKDISVNIDAAFKFILEGVQDRKITIEQGLTYQSMLMDIDKGIVYAVRGKNNHRLYHSFAGLKRELRQFVLYKGKPFVYQLDAVNSQPLLLGKILYAMYPDNVDVYKYHQLVDAGIIYEFFAERIYPDLNKKEGRNKIKTMFLSFFYTNNKATLSSDRKQFFQINSDVYLKVKDIFIEEFEFVWNKMQEIKEDGYNKLALLLAQIEAAIFTKKMDKTISNGCLPVHDSIMFTDEGKAFNIKRKLSFNEVKPNEINKFKQTINITNNLKYEHSTYNSF